MRFQRNVCLFVDAFSTGKKLVLDFISKGYDCVHIKSSKKLPPGRFSYQEKNFIRCITYDGDLNGLLSELDASGFNIKVCVPGSESGVELAEMLSEKLGLPTNGVIDNHARRNKYYMIKQVSRAKLKTVSHFKSKNSEEIIAWKKREVSQYPIVLKPLDSANGDGVFFCHTDNDVREAHKKILATPNFFGQKNEEVLAESFNYGQEYIINTVSCTNFSKNKVEHFTVEVWRVYRKPGTTIYDRAEIVHLNEREYLPLEHYTMKVLDTLQIRNGAATTELKYTPDGGPVLIETAARLMAGAPLSLSNELFGFTQVSLASMCLLSPKMFLDFISLPRRKIERFAIDVLLISDVEGVLEADLDITGFKSLETLHSFVLNREKDGKIKITTDSMTSPGEVFLISSDQKKLRSDSLKIRQLEREGLYRKAVLEGTMRSAGVLHKAGFLSERGQPSASKATQPPVAGKSAQFS